MSWPLSHDFNEAIQNPQLAFTDPDLKGAEAVVGARGLPLPRSGNFADVYQLRGADGRDWAVKCFTRPVVGLAERYARVSEALGQAKLPFVVGFTFLPEGMFVAGARRPVVKMEWVEGLLLNQVVRENAGKPPVLGALGQMWVRLCKRLRETRITHADLQHGNVLLVPGARPGAYGLKLIDYDGMYVPALANQPSGEVGHPSYQHPARAAARVYSPDVDRFPLLVVLAALKGLEVCGPGLWERHDTGDNLLFTEDDFRRPDGSKVMRELWLTDHPAVQGLVGRLAVSCGKPIPQTPWVDELAPDGEPSPLNNDTRRAAAAALGVALPVPVALPPEPTHGAPPMPVVVPLPPEPSELGRPASVVPEVDVELADERKAERKPEKKAERKRPVYRPPTEKSNSRALLVVGGILLLAGGIAAAVALSGGKKPDDTVQNPGGNDGDDGTVPREKEPDNTTPKEKEPKEKQPNPPNQTVKPLELQPVGRLLVKERWAVDIGTDPPITRLASSTDGSLVVVSGLSKIGARCLDAATGEVVPGSANKIVSAVRAVIPLDNGRFAVAQPLSDAAIPVWDPRQRKWENDLLRPIAGIMKMAGYSFVSRDARYLAFGGLGRGEDPAPFRLKDVTADRVLVELDLNHGQAFFTADSSRVLVADRTGKCQWFKLPSGQPDGEWEYKRRSGPGFAGPLAVSADGAVVLHEGHLVGHNELYHALDGRSGEVIRSFPGNYMPLPYRGNPLSANGRLVALLRRGPGHNDAIDVIETATGNVAAQLTPPADKEFHSAELLRDGSAVVALVGTLTKTPAETPQSVVRYDLVADAAPKNPSVPLKPLELKAKWESQEGVPANSHYFQFDPATDSLVVGDYIARALVMFDSKTGRPRGKPSSFEDSIGDCSPLGNGQYALYAKKRNEVLLWDSKTCQETGKVPVPELPTADGNPSLKVALSPNRKYLVVGRRMNFEIQPSRVDAPFRVFDAATGKPLVSTDWRGGSVHFTADSSRVLVAELTGRFRWFKLPSGEADGGWDFGMPPGTRHHVVYGITPDGAVLAYNGPRNGRDDTLLGPYVLSGKTGEPLHRFKDSYYGSAVSVSSDGQRAACQLAPDDNGLRHVVVDVASGVILAGARAPTGRSVPRFLLSPDGLSLVIHDARKLYGFEIPATFDAPAVKNPPPVTYPSAPTEPGKLHPVWVAGVDVGRDAARIHAEPDASVVLVGGPVAGHAALDPNSGTPRPGFADLGRDGVADFFKLDGGRVGSVTQSMAGVRVWDAKTGKEGPPVEIPDVPPGSGNAKALRAVLSPDGKYLAAGRAGIAVADNPEVPLRVFEAGTKKALVSTTWRGGSLHFTTDSSRLLVAEWSGRCRWFKLPGGAEDGGWDFGAPPPGQRHLVYGVSADGTVVAYRGPAGVKSSASSPGLVSGKTGEVTRRFPKHHFASDISLSADGRRAALLLDVTADACTLDVVDTATGTSLGTARLVTGRAVPSFALSPDGNVLFVHDPAANKLHRLDVVPPKSP